MKTKHNFSQFYALLKQMPHVDKEELVWEYSSMLTTSLTEFYEKNRQGYFDMIHKMQASLGNGEADIKALRSAILKRLQKAGIDTTNWDNVNTFLKDKRISGKFLFEMSCKEMQTLIPKLEMLLKKYNIQKQEIKRIAQLN